MCSFYRNSNRHKVRLQRDHLGDGAFAPHQKGWNREKEEEEYRKLQESYTKEKNMDSGAGWHVGTC